MASLRVALVALLAVAGLQVCLCGCTNGNCAADEIASAKLLQTKAAENNRVQIMGSKMPTMLHDGIQTPATAQLQQDSEGDYWTDAGATTDTGETVPVSGTVNTSTGGLYTITYTATDASGNVGTATRKVVVNAPGFAEKVFSGLDIYDDGVLYELTATISKDDFRVAHGQPTNQPTNQLYSEANQPTYDSNGDILLEMSGSFAEHDLVFWKVDYTFSPALPSTTGTVFADIKSNVGGQNPVGSGSGSSGGITSSTSTRTYFASHIGAPEYPSSQQITADDQVRKMTIQILHKADPNGNPLVLDDSLLVDFNVLWLDTVAPLITVTSGTDIVAQGDDWTDAGATADTGETVTVSGSVDTSTIADLRQLTGLSTASPTASPTAAQTAAPTEAPTEATATTTTAAATATTTTAAATATTTTAAAACQGNSATWDAGYGLCPTYVVGGTNPNYCNSDEAFGLKASQVCAECGSCTDAEYDGKSVLLQVKKASTPAPSTTPAPTDEGGSSR